MSHYGTVGLDAVSPGEAGRGSPCGPEVLDLPYGAEEMVPKPWHGTGTGRHDIRLFLCHPCHGCEVISPLIAWTYRFQAIPATDDEVVAESRLLLCGLGHRQYPLNERLKMWRQADQAGFSLSSYRPSDAISRPSDWSSPQERGCPLPACAMEEARACSQARTTGRCSGGKVSSTVR